jgi:hypothetical protein
MTDADFDLWTADTWRKFPAIAAWIRTTGGDLLCDWRDALAPCELSDLLAVNTRMLSGDDDGPGKFTSDWQGLPAHVRRLAAAVRLRREIAEPLDRSTYEPQGPRYRCSDCRDSGRRFVAHPSMLAAWYRGDVGSAKYRTAIVLCECQQSNPIRTRQGQEKNKDGTATFKDGLHFPLPWVWLPMWERREAPPDMLTAFVEWCEQSHKAWANSKRHREFDDFNNQP